MNEKIKLTLKIIFFILMLIGTIYYQLPFILGVFGGIILISYIYLFPSTYETAVLNKVFDYDKSLGVNAKNENEKANNEREKLRVKFNKNN